MAGYFNIKELTEITELGSKNNPDFRAYFHLAWLVADRLGKPIKTKEDYDNSKIAEVQDVINKYYKETEAAAAEINKKLGRPVLLLIPIGNAVTKLRAMVIDGKYPGVNKQSDLFNDAMPHPGVHVMALNGYCHFAAIYRKSPEGLKIARFKELTDEQHTILQKIAWETVSKYPYAGIAKPDATTVNRPLVFVFTGESNSGGIGKNADATPAEQAARPSVQIMNLTNGLFTFEPLLLGTNNLRDHAGLEGYYAKCHGLENGLANAVEAGAFAGRKQVYLIKTGQGGSRIAEGAPDHKAGYWRKFGQRLDAAKRQLPANSQWVVWFSLGINDGIAGTSIAKWKQDTLAHLKRIKTELPGAPMVMTQFQSMKRYAQLDAAIKEIAAEEPGVFVVDSTGAAMEADQNHWNYAGLKTVAQRMVEVTQKALEKKQ